MLNGPDTLHAPVLQALNLPWARVLHLGQKSNHARGSSIFWDGGNSLDFWYIAQGRVFVMHNDRDGRQRAIFLLASGNLFNEAPAAAGFDAPDSPFICAERSVLYRFPHLLLHDADFVAAYPDLIINLMQGMGVKLLGIHTSLGNATGIPAIARVARFIISLALRHNQTSFRPGLTQHTLAIILGIDRSTLVRSLHELKRAGAIVTFTKNQLVIRSLPLLQHFAEAASS